MTLISPTEFSRRCNLSKQAIFKGMADGLIPFQNQGKKKYIDIDNESVTSYMADNNRQRDQVKKNDKEPSKLPTKKKVKTKTPSNIRDKNITKHEDMSDLSPSDIKRRAMIADMKRKEAQAEIMQKNYLPRDFILGSMMMYLERVGGNIERVAAVFINDSGEKILEAGEVRPDHIQEFINSVLATIHSTKKEILKTLAKYEPKNY